MTEDRFTSAPPPLDGPQPSVVPPLTWQLILANFLTQVVFALAIGVVALIVFSMLSSEAAAARGAALVATLIGLWAARSLIHWPIPKATLKAQGQLPPNIRPAETGGREIVETVVFVVVLVLLLKSFAAEAFVIPTGSMAETLYGYQKYVKCPSCAFEFPINCSTESDPGEKAPAIVNAGICPVCDRHIRLVDPRWRQPREGELPGDYMEIADPGASTGDRVLVGKFLYDPSLPGAKPGRLDVVVFKYPKEPQKNHVSTNYIKRLIGMPEETIAISGGDLYILRPEKSPKHDDSTVKPADLWKEENMHSGSDTAAEEKFKAGEFEILRKPPSILLSMMRIVHDNDYLDPKLAGLRVRWRPEGDTWEKLEGGKSFRHPTPADTNAQSWLRYHHVLRASDKQGLILDFMGYNSGETFSFDRRDTEWGQPDRNQEARSGGNWVGDLILECEVKIEKAQGELVLDLVRSGEHYRATFDLASEDGRCTLSHGEKGTEKKLESQPTRLGKGTHKVRFANVDQRLTVWVDGTLPFENGVNYSPPAVKGPKAADLQPVSIGVKGAAATVQNIKLFRDSYYTCVPSSPDIQNIDPFDPNKWEDLQRPPLKTMFVQPGHYLCLGDNSPASSDGRSWGLVPERLLLGRALLVYWPWTNNRAGRIR